MAAYVAALALVFVATIALVLGVAFMRVGPHSAEVANEVNQFARSAPGVMASALLSATVLAVVAVVSALRETHDLRARLRLAPTRASRAGLLAAVSGLVGLSLVTGSARDLAGLGDQGSMGAIAQALHGPTPIRFALALVTIAIGPGVAEEAFFRGLIQTRLVARWGRWPSIAATAFGFGLFHLDLIQGPAAFVTGLFLGWLVERVGGIRPAIAAHVFNNTLFVALASFGSTGDLSRSVAIQGAVVGLVVFIGSALLLRSARAVEADAQLPHP